MVYQGRARFAAAVYAVLGEGGRVLLMRRAGSGYRDGELSLPAGHLDGNEDAVAGLRRELREELGVEVDPSHLPDDVVDYIARSLAALHTGERLVLHGWAQ